MKKEVKYLGHVISENGIKPDPDKVEAIKKYSLPTSVRDIRAFLGLAEWYRRFIPRFSVVAQPLSDLTEGREK